jgi:hypothetical protein
MEQGDLDQPVQGECGAPNCTMSGPLFPCALRGKVEGCRGAVCGWGGDCTRYLVHCEGVDSQGKRIHELDARLGYEVSVCSVCVALPLSSACYEACFTPSGYHCKLCDAECPFRRFVKSTSLGSALSIGHARDLLPRISESRIYTEHRIERDEELAGCSDDDGSDYSSAESESPEECIERILEKRRFILNRRIFFCQWCKNPETGSNLIEVIADQLNRNNVRHIPSSGKDSFDRVWARDHPDPWVAESIRKCLCDFLKDCLPLLPDADFRTWLLLNRTHCFNAYIELMRHPGALGDEFCLRAAVQCFRVQLLLWIPSPKYAWLVPFAPAHGEPLGRLQVGHLSDSVFWSLIANTCPPDRVVATESHGHSGDDNVVEGAASARTIESGPLVPTCLQLARSAESIGLLDDSEAPDAFDCCRCRLEKWRDEDDPVRCHRYQFDGWASCDDDDCSGSELLCHSCQMYIDELETSSSD